MNAFLLVLAIGLATLDFTCFWVLQVRAAMPAATSAAAAAPSSAHGKAHAAAASTSQPSAMAAGF